MRPEADLIDILWAHRHAVPLVKIDVLNAEIAKYYNQPINTIPPDLIRLACRHQTMGTDMQGLANAPLVPRLTTHRKWF